MITRTLDYTNDDLKKIKGEKRHEFRRSRL